MTVKQAFNYILTELNKVKAPSLLLDDFVYFWNKATLQYVNLEYNSYNTNQQKSDNLSSLMQTYVATGNDILPIGADYNNSAAYVGTSVINLSVNYNHLLNCIIEFAPITPNVCPSNGNLVYGAKRLTEDMYPTAIRNYYFKPSVKNPYYFIHTVDKPTFNVGSRNTSPISTGYRMEIRFGQDSTLYTIENIFIDYVRVPTFVKLSQDDLDDIIDNSDILEFSDYVCQEIINRCVFLILENQSNPRMNSNLPVNQTIFNTSSQQQSKK